MTAAHEPNETDGPHEGPIKTPKQLILAVLYAFVVPIFGIILLVTYVTADRRPAAGSDALSPKAVAERIRPVGIVEVKDASDIASLKTGEQVFAAQCTACHGTGALGSPKLGDVEAWAPRIKTGFDALLHSALTGKGQMPPQGGGDFSDYEIARAVVYMTGKAGAKFAEPAPPSAAASAAATTTAAATAAPAMTTAAANPAATTTSTASTPAANAKPLATTAAAAPAAPTPAPTAAPAAATTPPPLFAQICTTCHTPGIAGAPKVGDKAAWAPRIAEGIDALTANAIKGKGAMPPKGGSSASDADIKAVVTYMVNASK
ncbi:MAG TPA: c-type cytochrome [Caldimonas sp.]|nr:c-type cytochrome [Caldimonas sp.]HEV7578228.1 c-type cytochrome [Caldimonas sp.]